jgi:hypothetical protein
VFTFCASKLYDHNDKNEQSNELINTHLRPPPIPNEGWLIGRHFLSQGHCFVPLIHTMYPAAYLLLKECPARPYVRVPARLHPADLRQIL